LKGTAVFAFAGRWIDADGPPSAAKSTRAAGSPCNSRRASPHPSPGCATMASIRHRSASTAAICNTPVSLP
jgi:hypothetical protein